MPKDDIIQCRSHHTLIVLAVPDCILPESLTTHFVELSRNVFIKTKASSYIKSSPLALLLAISDLRDRKCLRRVSNKSGPAEAIVCGVRRSGIMANASGENRLLDQGGRRRTCCGR